MECAPCINKRSLSFWLPHQYPISIPLFLHACYMFCPSYPLDLIILIIVGEKHKFWGSSLCSFLQPPCLFIPLWSKCSPQRPVLKHPQSMRLFCPRLLNWFLCFYFGTNSIRCCCPHWDPHFSPALHCSYLLPALQGLEYCHVFCHVCFFPRLQDFIMNQDWNDPKSKLQQCCLTLRTMEGGEPDIPVYKYVKPT
jgi:hypothetical protein